jgi:hypothetical protein
VSIDPLMLLRVLDACDAQQEEAPLVSFVFPTPGGGVGQVFLAWKQGRYLKDYLRDPVLEGKLSLYAATHSRIVDHRNIKRRLTHVLQPGDELRFIRTTPIGGLQ